MNICGNLTGCFDDFGTSNYGKSTHNNLCGFSNRIADNKRCELDKAFAMAPRVWDINYGDIRVISHPGFPEGKIMCKTRTTDNHRSLKNYVWEINKRMNLDHNNLIKMIDYSYFSVYKWCAKYWTINLYFYYYEQSLAKELMARKSLGRSFTERELVTILYDLVDVLSSLQQRSISHGDIRPESVFQHKMPTRDFVVTKLCDRISNEDPKKAQIQHLFNHRPQYMSPELFYNLNTGNVNIIINPFKADAFSLGLLILDLANLKPFNLQDIYMKAKNTIDFHLIQKLIYEFTLKYPYSVWIGDVLYCLLNADPNIRQNFTELKLNLPERNSVLHYYDKLTILDVKHLEGLRKAHKTVPFDKYDIGIGQQNLYSNLRYKLDPTLDIPKLKYYPFGMQGTNHEEEYHSMYARPGNVHLDPHHPSFIADLTPPGQNFNYNNAHRAYSGGKNSSGMLNGLRNAHNGGRKKSFMDDLQSCGGGTFHDTHHTEMNGFVQNHIDRPMNNDAQLGQTQIFDQRSNIDINDRNSNIDWDRRSRAQSPARARSEILGHDANRIENLSQKNGNYQNQMENLSLKNSAYRNQNEILTLNNGSAYQNHKNSQMNTQFDLDMQDIGIDDPNLIYNSGMQNINNPNGRKQSIGDLSVKKRGQNSNMSPKKAHFLDDPLHRRMPDSRRSNSVNLGDFGY